jgi:hypothetical protein
MDELKKRMDAFDIQLLKLTNTVDAQLAALTKIVSASELTLNDKQRTKAPNTTQTQIEMDNSDELLDKMQRRKTELNANKTVNLKLEKTRDALKRLVASRSIDV